MKKKNTKIMTIKLLVCCQNLQSNRTPQLGPLGEFMTAPFRISLIPSPVSCKHQTYTTPISDTQFPPHPIMPRSSGTRLRWCWKGSSLLKQDHGQRKTDAAFDGSSLYLQLTLIKSHSCCKVCCTANYFFLEKYSEISLSPVSATPLTISMMSSTDDRSARIALKTTRSCGDGMIQATESCG